MTQEHLKIVIVGHVDHGKSTLIGRLFYDTDSLPEGKFEAIKGMCERRGMPFEWAFLMDALKTERDQGITIDTALIHFQTALRRYTIIDAPGHKEFLKNMITGASNASAALLVIDAHEGVQEQSKRHGFLLHLLGITQVAVLINKMDLVGYSQEKFEAVKAEYTAYLASLGVVPAHVIPISAREGDHIKSASANMPWYHGVSVVQALDGFSAPVSDDQAPLRFPVQDVYKFDDRRIIAGRIESGKLKVGDEILFSPTHKKARIKSIETFPSVPKESAAAGESVGITLDEHLFIERGHVISHVTHPPFESHRIKARLFWLGRESLRQGHIYKMKLGTAEYSVKVESIDRVIDIEKLEGRSGVQQEVPRNGIADIILRAQSLVAIDNYRDLPRTGRFVLVDGYDVAGGGIIDLTGEANERESENLKRNVFEVSHKVTLAEREARQMHKPAILWMTGLSASGKSTLALELEKELFKKGYQVYVLDGDNVRGGLNQDLGFDKDDRTENIRRVSEVAKLFADAGFIVLTAFISPYAADRERARFICGDDFHEIYIKASLQACEARDPKKLYAKARKGDIPHFTGISDPYEAPTDPQLVVDSEHMDVESSVEQLLEYVTTNCRIG